MTTFSDIFKKSFLEEAGNLSVDGFVLSMLAAFLCGMVVYTVYRNFYKGVVYNQNFNILLVLTSLVTCFVVIVISSNVVLSLGMVGALSIVRFRAAIKEPMEIVYLFWAIAAGIVIGAGMIPLAVIGSVVIGGILLVFSNRKMHENPYILILNCQDGQVESAAMAMTKDAVARFAVKSKTVNASGIELTAEISMKDGETAFVNALSALEGVSSATLVSYNGDYMS